MWIRFVQAPKHVCEDKQEHYNEHLKVFIGMVLDGEPNPKGTMYQVPLQQVLLALLRRKEEALVEVHYWSGHWLRTGISLSDFVYFPADCVEVLES